MFWFDGLRIEPDVSVPTFAVQKLTFVPAPELEPPVDEHGTSVEERVARVAARIPRVHAVAIEPVVVPRHSARDPVRELGELRLGENDRARGLEILRQRRFIWRHEIGEGERAAGRRHVRRMDVVLERDGNAVQRTENAPVRALAVERVGDGERARIHRDDRVQLVLVRRDAREILRDDLVRRRAMLLERGAHVGDAGFDDGESLRGRGSRGDRRQSHRREHSRGGRADVSWFHGTSESEKHSANLPLLGGLRKPRPPRPRRPRDAAHL